MMADEDDVPQVRPTGQKGYGLSSLKASMALFSDVSNIPYPTGMELSAEEKKELFDQQRQRQVEADTVSTAMERWRKEMVIRQKAGVDMTDGGKRLGSMVSQWHSDLAAKIKEINETERKRNHMDYRSAANFLMILEPDKLAAITILAVMAIFSRGGMDSGAKLVRLAMRIGKDVEDERIADATLQQDAADDTGRQNALKRLFAARKDKGTRSRWQALAWKMRRKDPSLDWPQSTTARGGAELMSLLFDVAKLPVKVDDPETNEQVEVLQPAFQHSYRYVHGRRHGLINLHPALVKVLGKEPPAHLLGRHLPMVCRPRPWKDVNDGGYFLQTANIIRTTPGETLQPAYTKAAMQGNGLEQVRQGLDVLGSTSWSINRQLFNVMIEAWNTGEAIANLAPLDPPLPIPRKPSRNEGAEAQKTWRRKMREIENEQSAHHSLRCFQNFQMEVARAYRNEKFYLPHNLDFRGRAYPLPPYLNQMGADNARALLLFGEAKPLGPSGLRWLKIQLANLYGYDKTSFFEREQFAMDHLDDIYDSADNGLHGKRWWLEAEDPWQCLAACIELTNAMRHPDPTEFLSRLPIHQDGSCNGLQHYAALGGDQVGAEQVNLEPSDRPSDVYTGVSEYIKEAVAKDAAESHPIAQLLVGRITRKIVKQTVMTNVYGVTFIGALRQVLRQLDSLHPDLTQVQKKESAFYIARKIFNALSSMFNGAHGIQYWLGDCAYRITHSLSPEQIEGLAKEAMTTGVTNDKKTYTEKFQTTVIWTTPLGLPVVQPYRSRKTAVVLTRLQRLNLNESGSGDTVSARKQLQAFPPNFIHSLDATHMMLSANACNKAGLTFSAVHDSFWTHASDVDSMNTILRDAFVLMHSDDVIRRLAEEFQVRFGNHLYLAKLRTDSPVTQAIQKYRAERPGPRLGQVNELLLEWKRQNLLKSEDPERQERGRNLKTPASIFHEMGGTEADLAIQNSLGESEVGHVPEDIETAMKNVAPADSQGLPESDALAEEDEAIDDDSHDSAKPKSKTPKDDVGEFDAFDEDAAQPRKKRNPKRDKYQIGVWLPMTFREVPNKGAWDLKRIRESPYFFS